MQTFDSTMWNLRANLPVTSLTLPHWIRFDRCNFWSWKSLRQNRLQATFFELNFKILISVLMGLLLLVSRTEMVIGTQHVGNTFLETILALSRSRSHTFLYDNHFHNISNHATQNVCCGTYFRNSKHTCLILVDCTFRFFCFSWIRWKNKIKKWINYL